ncbi:efflux RND transporter periplasmic adaptor subunit [Thalassomonas actiniarum]|uniref:HlyD family efflux transporter periplasmic adaptor subunit n=1 Tax=Thalassomonas actiniarum TaxID=485447 RepID=A0AAE9YUK7_9GAMM|nr:HlyD family efflux transporter periplasmic adaptor subunit [Thalassomonas actiniarum]WDE00605.1 HlyD family efflux transporter periplasmic adaptor subunit [Thalassomonas actiniarum]
MDINRAKAKKSALSRYWPWSILVFLLAGAAYYLYFLAQADFAIDSETLVIGQVKQGKFSVSVRGSGVLVPDNIQWLSANVDARVERILAKPGKIVNKGDLIVELSNPKLVQLLEETQWELEAVAAENEAERVIQESALLDQKTSVLNARLDYESSKLEQDAHSELFQKKTGAVSKIDYQRTRLETKQFKQRWHIQQQRLAKMTENLSVQNNARDARLKKMRKTLERVRQDVNSLKVYASINSVVQDVPVEAGQRITMGGNIAKLARQDSLIAELQVPELQIRDVMIGQKVVIDTRNNKASGVVTRVDPAVVNGNVQVDVSFSGELPGDARPDLTVDGEIKIAEISDTLYVSRPLFAQSQSTASFYKVTDSGNFASRVKVKLGKGSVDQIQILEGLAPGEKIIISDPSTWESYQKVRIN